MYFPGKESLEPYTLLVHITECEGFVHLHTKLSTNLLQVVWGMQINRFKCKQQGASTRGQQCIILMPQEGTHWFCRTELIWSGVQSQPKLHSDNFKMKLVFDKDVQGLPSFINLYISSFTCVSQDYLLKRSPSLWCRSSANYSQWNFMTIIVNKHIFLHRFLQTVFKCHLFSVNKHLLPFICISGRFTWFIFIYNVKQWNQTTTVHLLSCLTFI